MKILEKKWIKTKISAIFLSYFKKKRIFAKDFCFFLTSDDFILSPTSDFHKNRVISTHFYNTVLCQIFQCIIFTHQTCIKTTPFRKDVHFTHRCSPPCSSTPAVCKDGRLCPPQANASEVRRMRVTELQKGGLCIPLAPKNQ